MQVKPFPENTALNYFILIIIPVLVWSTICFLLIVLVDGTFSSNVSAGIGIVIGVTWFIVCGLFIYLGKRLFLPDQRKCPTCNAMLKLSDDGENTHHFYTCMDCKMRWRLNLRRGYDD